MLNLFRQFTARGRKPIVDKWSSSTFDLACTRLATLQAEDARLKGRFQELSPLGTYEAAVELDPIRARLDALVPELAAAERDVEREAEVEMLVNQLLPAAVTLRGLLDKKYEAFCSRADTPDDETEWVPFERESKEFEQLRLTIVRAVGPVEAERLDLSRGFNFVAAVQQHWTEIARDRERLATLHGPGNKIRFGQPSWFRQADRLARLRAASPVRKEIA